MTVYSNDRHDAAPGTRRARSMDEIEGNIHDIRSRMDATLDEIEFRLSPGQMSGGVIDVVRDVVQGNPTRVARAIRENPIPVALMGIGALWLAWAVSRTPVVAGPVESMGATLSDQRLRILLTGLVGACRQGAEAFREADAAIADARVSTRLMEVSNQLERTSAALDHELRVRGGRPDLDGPMHPAWEGVHTELAGDRSPVQLLASLERGLDGTLDVFRDCLQEDLPPDLRVTIGAHFHDLERVEHHVGALREAAA
ncbi:MAG TPA: hypothetical protein VD995_23170 [Azospirillum sp.]|nr:hypothetical protein [Azospirillum sp.]